MKRKILATFLSVGLCLQLPGMTAFAEPGVKISQVWESSNRVSVQAADMAAAKEGVNTVQMTDQGNAVETGAKISDKIKPDQTQGVANRFLYAAYRGKQWVTGENEAYIDLGASDGRAEECYYEIEFIGSEIEVFANKSKNHGMVHFSVDGASFETADLYAPQRTGPQSVCHVSGLKDGEKHVLKAVTSPDKNPGSSSVVNQVAYAVVTHEEYEVRSITLDEPEYRMPNGSSRQILYTADPPYADITDLTFTSNAPEIAVVDSKGVIKAESAGEAFITISSVKWPVKEILKVKVTDMSAQMMGSIVDIDTQYTQERYQEVRSMPSKITDKTLYAWKNDTAVSVIALISVDSRLNGVKVEAGDFKTSDGSRVIDRSNITTAFIKPTKAFAGKPAYGGDIIPPVPQGNRKESSDILDSSVITDIRYNQLQPVWVTVHVPEDTQDGVYTGVLTVTADGIAAPMEFTYHLEVFDAVLPDAKEFKDGFDIELWQYPYSSAEYYGVEPFSKEHLAILSSNMELYKSIGGHAVTTTISEDAWNGQTYSKNDVHYPSMIRWIKNEDGSFSYDYSDFDQWVQFNRDLGIGDKIVLYSIAPWHNSFTYWDGDMLVYEPFTAGSERYKKVWGDFFRDLADHLDQKGWFDSAYIGIDERGFNHAAFDLIDTIKNQEGKTFKVAGAMDEFRNPTKRKLAMRVTDLNVGDTAVKGVNRAAFEEMRKEREELGLRTTLYSCTGHIPGNFSLSAPAESYWSMMFAAKLGTSGFLRWAYDAWVEDPLSDTTHYAFESGDCFLVFPDEKDAAKPKSKRSVRLEMMAAGVRDVNKLMLMKQAYPSLADDVDAVLAHAKEDYDHSAYYLTDAGKQEIAGDMSKLRLELVRLTQKYIKLKDNSTAGDRPEPEESARVAYYSFDDMETDTVKDQWNHHDGENKGGILVEGKSGTAMDFTEGTEKITIHEPVKLPYEWSVSFWINSRIQDDNRAAVLWDGRLAPKNISIDAQVGSDNQGNKYGLGVHVDTVDNGTLSAPYQIPKGVWTHIGITNSKDHGLRFYADGQLISENAYTKTHYMAAPLEVIGGFGFKGSLDELKVFNRELSGEELRSEMLVKGLNVINHYLELFIGDSTEIVFDLVTDQEDKKITFRSEAPEIAKVDEKGRVTAVGYGDTSIIITGGGYKETVDVRVNKNMEIQYTILQYDLPDKNISILAQDLKQYYGQPDMVMLDDNRTLITVYPEGHGVGNVLMKKSADAGSTWVQTDNTPPSWKNSQETPTLYKLDFRDGSQKLIMITGCPGVWGDYSTGWNTSVSTDEGATWSEYQHFYQGSPTIVAMASLVHLKDENGEFMDKWMGVYHDNNFYNYKTYLTFDENGNEHWSTPEKYLSEYRDIEKIYQICEVGMFRSPDGKRIMALARSQSHKNKSVMFYSDDEGKTFSRPIDVQGALQGERHKAVYDPVSKRLVVVFREITLDYNKNGVIEDNDWRAGDWIAWVGTYEDLMNGREGEYRIRLKEDFTNNAKGGDCGYSGIAVLPDGTFIICSYGHWDKELAQANQTGNARNDPAFIIQAKFKLSEFDNW